jgi:NTP pyrophosphatase (non-canonical NTP hydrolase)
MENEMDFNSYQHQAGFTAQYPRDGLNGLLYTTLGLASEAGEVAGKVKKILRDDNGVLSDEKREQLIAELGDVLWYSAMLAYELRINLGVVASRNIDKLSSRKERGVIGGSGDNR